MEELMDRYMEVWKQAQVEKANGGVSKDTAKELQKLEDAINKIERGVPR